MEREQRTLISVFAIFVVYVCSYFYFVVPNLVNAVSTPNGVFGPYKYNSLPKYLIGPDWLFFVILLLAIWNIILIDTDLREWNEYYRWR
jgi:hypothetical protein